MGRKKVIIHVNQHEIKKNRKNGTCNPVLTCKFGSRPSKARGTNVYAHEAVIRDDRGREVARVVYRPDHPLSCGAHVWIETENEVLTIVNDDTRGHNDQIYRRTSGKDAPIGETHDEIFR